MNKVFLIGRLTKDPELRYTGSNVPVASFTLAVNRNYTSPNGEREADFIPVVVWRKQAENVKNYLSQGRQAAVEGRMQVRTYDDKDGKRVYVTEVVADNVEFLGGGNSSKQNNPSSSTEQPLPANGEGKADPTPYDFGTDQKPTGTDVNSNPFADFGSSIEVNDDDLPF